MDQDPDCGCKNGDYYCGIGCDYTNDSDCAKTCSQAGYVCCSDSGKICTTVITGFSGCDECCENIDNCVTPTCNDPDEKDIHIQGTCQDSVSQTPQTDFCYDNDTVNEFSCVRGRCDRETIDCPSGEVCRNGACVVSSSGVVGVTNLPTPKLELAWPPSPMGTYIEEAMTPEGGLPKLVQYFYEWLIVLGGLAAFIALVIAGFQYLTSAGNATKMADAISRIRSAVLGLLLLLGSFLILNTINPQLTELRMPGTESLPSTLNITGEIDAMRPNFEPCEKIYFSSGPLFSGSSGNESITDTFQNINQCGGGWCDVPIMSIRTSYTDTKTNEEKTGGMCQIELYGQYDCNKSTILTSLNGGKYGDLSAVVQSKVQCIKVKQLNVSLPGL